jgi:endo-1,4-beta-D-glucanase Y
MKKIWVYGMLMMAIMSILSCEKVEQEAELSVSSIKVKVTNASGAAEANMPVYLFDKPATEVDGKNPLKALKTATTNEEGVALLNVQGMAAFQSGAVFYVTALEQLLSKETLVLGSAEVSKGQDVIIEKELSISERSLKYANGYLPTTITSELAINEYERWKKTQVLACGDGLRVKNETAGETLVEAMGFGSLLSAYANDKATFDGLIRFYKSKRTPESKNMMGWKVTCDGIIDPGSATDGDLDVAFALIVAHKQWNEAAYLDDAKDILRIVRDNLLIPCTANGQELLVVGPGYSGVSWGGCNMMDIMYHTPAFFRVFATVTGDDIWARLADDTYPLLNNGANATTGLVPDWQTASGRPGPGGRVGYFGYDACRAPWRITLDYLWNGNAEAKAWTTKISSWANGVGPANIVDGYELDGKPIGTNGLNSAFLGGFAVATMSNNQAMVNSFSKELGKLNDTYWFNLNTRCLYLFTLTGNFWNPLEER